MTDQPPTEVAPIFVKGQRRGPGGVFPPVSGGGGGIGGPIGPVQDELDPNEQPVAPPHPCDDEDEARDWNADAAAAEAFRRIQQYVRDRQLTDPTHDLANREYGAMICEHPNGTFSVSSIQHGDPIFDENGILNANIPTVDVNAFACGNGAKPLAMFHTHPSTGSSAGIPSSVDSYWVSWINLQRQDNHGRIYVGAIDGANHRIQVYDITNIDGASSGVNGPEVNPDGLPCLSAGTIL